MKKILTLTFVLCLIAILTTAGIALNRFYALSEGEQFSMIATIFIIDVAMMVYAINKLSDEA